MAAFLRLSNHIRLSMKPINFGMFTFAGGEEHIKILDVALVKKLDRVLISSSLTSSKQIMSTIMATDAIRSINNNAKIELFTPYFPYARQDRRMVPGEPHSIRAMSNLLNSQNFNKVHVLDPHSDVTPALVNNIEIIDNQPYIAMAINEIKENNQDTKPDDFYLVSPDAGAEKKIYKSAEMLKMNVIRGSKKRDVATGKITQTEIIGDVKGKICTIIDDILDGGATFIELGKVLKESGAKKIYLVVSHGIFSKGTEPFQDLFEKIYTTDSFKTVYDPKVRMVEIDSFWKN